jgi:hypothetical protein
VYVELLTVEDHVDPLNSDGGINDDTLASLVIMANNHSSALVLVGNQRRNVRLDATSSETDNNDSNDETSETRAMVESSRDSCTGEDQETGHVDETEDDNGVVLSEVLVGNNGTKNGGKVAPELEEGAETSGSLMAHTERTTAELAAARARDVVLEETRGTIVCETLKNMLE